jgi:hypothetical protein
MGHPSIDNSTPFVFEPLFLRDEEARPLFVPVVKATYSIGANGLDLAEEQDPVNLTGDLYGEPEESSYRYEPEVAFAKPATDLVLLGCACPSKEGAAEGIVAFQVGSVRKGLRVVGDRTFYEALGTIGMTDPLPFERIPLQWERAFGGWDRSDPDPAKHTFEPRNPVGVGFRAPGSRFEEGLRAPNFEDPMEPFRGWGHHPTPAGFGFVSPHWEPRADLAGTYDESWEKTRAPLLPKDFDRRYLNAASPGLVAEGFLAGNEPVVVVGASKEGRLAFSLPGTAPPSVRASFATGRDKDIWMNLDTVIVNAEERRVFMLWRGNLLLRQGAHDVRSIVIEQN